MENCHVDWGGINGRKGVWGTAVQTYRIPLLVVCLVLEVRIATALDELQVTPARGAFRVKDVGSRPVKHTPMLHASHVDVDVFQCYLLL